MSTPKFKVGQPVWSIGHCTGKWRPATVLQVIAMHTSICMMCGATITGLHYIVDVDCEGRVPTGGRWGDTEDRLRPRDPDQFEAADEDFSLHLESFSLIKEVRASARKWHRNHNRE